MAKRNQFCDCGTERWYSAKWDSYFCGVCVKWLDKQCPCSAEDCEFVGRPETPKSEKDGD